MHEFLKALAQRPILFDGAIGTELYQRGVFLTNNFEELNLSKPSLVVEVHRDYRKAGAEVLTTNSYGANRFRLERFGLADQMVEINRAAARLAMSGASGAAWVAGSVGPSGLDSAAFLGPDAHQLVQSLEVQITSLLEGGADLILLETFEQLAEMQIAIETALRVGEGHPVLATMRFSPQRRLPDGSEPEAVAKALASWGADVIGVNCGEGPDLAYDVGVRMLGQGAPVMAQPNAGTPSMLEGRTIYAGNPEYFGVFGRRMLKAGIRVVGGCCGTTPAHVHRMRGAARMMGGAVQVIRNGEHQVGNVRDVETPAVVDQGQSPVPAEQRSELARKMMAGKFVVSVEVNPPFGLDPSASLDAAKMLRDAGVDVVNTADGPRATVRMSNLAQALLVREQLGMETILHVCCRDRNLLGLQSDLLGAHVLGIRNLVIITGDPPKLGDFPDATAVYDLDSIGLLRYIDGYNHGLDPAGKAMPQPTSFWAGTGVEPGAADYDRELRRLEEKIEAGANFVMTQPVYDPRMIERLLDDVAHLKVPILVGLLPLASSRNAEFLHNEVPGMQIPQEIRDRMAKVGGGRAGRAEGIKIAQEALLAVRDRVQGAYIMPPFGRYEMAPAILEVLGEEWKQWPPKAVAG
jgi:homocysteine S-methyltransferase